MMPNTRTHPLLTHDYVISQGFLANVARGLRPPFTGANDAQANCIVRVPPLVAAWAGA